MPVYEYRCRKCGEEFEAERRLTDESEVDCPNCGTIQVQRLISRTSFALKGGGWFRDGY